MEQQNNLATEVWITRKLASREPNDSWTPNASEGISRLRQKQADQRRRSYRLLVASTITLAIATAGLAHSPIRAYAKQCVDACVVECQAVVGKLFSRPSPGISAHVYLATATKRPVAADFASVDQNGNSIQLSSLRGSVVLINFWATWCPPCREEIPWFNQFQKEFASQGFSVIGISMDEPGWKIVCPFIEKQPVNYPILTDGEALAKKYGGLESLPATLLIDRQGKIAAIYVGKVSKSEYEARIRQMLGTE